jgi:cell fate regulator YaaT (PSP1 superfamily)
MLDVYDWLSNVYYVDDPVRHPFVEVRFKGTRKSFYKNPSNIALEIGQKVVVESAMGGHDVGVVSLVGPLVKLQMKRYGVQENANGIQKIYRVCTQNDLERYREAKAREYVTMMQSRDYARDLRLQMKISDVEFQGDNTKATFYYTAEGRVDFRELIKVFAKNFKIKVEMRQIGLRQEAGRLGGIGSCGRELCCSTWLTEFNNVPTTAARYQNLFLNPLKLSGQCGRLKCCLNYELDTYVEALENFPDDNIKLVTAKGVAKVVKTDVLKGLMYFVVQDDTVGKFIPLHVDDVKDLLERQKSGDLPTIEDIEEYSSEEEPEEKEVSISGDISADALDRFDSKFKKNKKKRKKPKGREGQQAQGQVPGKPLVNPDQGPRQGRDATRPQRADNSPRRDGSGQRPPGAQGNRPAPANREPGQKPPLASGEGQRPQDNNRRNNNNRNRNRGPRPDAPNPSNDGN